MENLQKQETVAKIMELINGGQDFYELAVELAFSQKVNQEVYNLLLEEQYKDSSFFSIKIMLLRKEMYLIQLGRLVNGIPLSNFMYKNTEIDGRKILVKSQVCQICLPF